MGTIETSFFLSENERRIAAEKESAYPLYRLFEFGPEPKGVTRFGGGIGACGPAW